MRTNANRKLKNGIFIVVTVLSSSVGNVFLAIGLKQTPQFRFPEILAFLVSLLTNSWIVTGTALLTVWMITQLIMFTWADLSYVLPMTAIVFILTAILSKVLLQEQLSISRWAGVGLISFAVILVAETPPRTSGKPGKCG